MSIMDNDEDWSYAGLTSRWSASQHAFSDQFFERAKREIEADIEHQALPPWIGDYDDMEHFAVNSGAYGELSAPEIEAEGCRLFPPPAMAGDLVGYQKACTVMRERIHGWLRSRPGAIPNARFRDDFDQMLKHFNANN